jgi:hypothetical protein
MYWKTSPFLKTLTVLLLHFCYFIINSVACEIYDVHGTVHKHNFPIIAFSFASNFGFREQKVSCFLGFVPWFNLYAMSGDCIK